MAQIVQVADPKWVNRGVSAREARVDTLGVYMPDPTDPMQIRSGVLPGATPAGRLTVTAVTPTAAMSVVVSAGLGVVASTGQGVWEMANEAPVTVDVPTANATNPRIDIVIMRTYDLDVGDTTPAGISLPTNQRGLATIEVFPGVASSTPAVPATPTRAIKLAELAVAANATQILTGNITLKRKGAAVRGGARVLLEDDLVSGAGVYVGEARIRNNRVEVWGADSLWHGCAPLPQTAVTGPGSPITSITGTNTSIINTTITDPGWPYQLLLSGVMEFNSDPGALGDANFRLGSAAGTQVGYKAFDPAYNAYGTGGSLSSSRQAVLPARPTGVLTGNTTVHLCLVRSGGSGTAVGAVAAGSELNVTILPA